MPLPALPTQAGSVWQLWGPALSTEGSLSHHHLRTPPNVDLSTADLPSYRPNRGTYTGAEAPASQRQQQQAASGTARLRRLEGR